MYEDFANYYDALMGDADYDKRFKYLCGLFEKFDRTPTLLLDLACGTGAFSNRFAKAGVSVIGVDISPEMLTVARENSQNEGNDVLYLCQDMTKLELYGTVDGIICCLDSLNHITDYGNFCTAVDRASLFLEPERLFIFDVNTVYKHRSILKDNTFVIDDEDVYCVWQNQFDKDTNSVDITLDFFENDGENYTRSSQFITERAYTKGEIASALKNAGLKIEAVLEDLTLDGASRFTQRAVYVTRKVK